MRTKVADLQAVPSLEESLLASSDKHVLHLANQNTF